MSKLHLSIPTVLLAASIPMVSLVGCNKQQPTNLKLVQFDTQCGSHIDAVQVEIGETVDEPVSPTREGYNFAGWYDDEACTEGKEHNFSLPVNSDITIYAKWTGGPTPPDVYYTIVFKEVPSPIPSESVKDGDLAIEPEEPTKPGFEFIAWYTESECTHLFDWSARIRKNYTLYAGWKSTGDYDYTVTLQSDGILDLNNKTGKLGHDYVGLISVSQNYIGKYDVPNSHAYYDVTINGNEYDDFTVETIGTDSNYMVAFTIKEEDLHMGCKIVITPNVQVEHYLKFTAREDGAQVGFKEDRTTDEWTYHLQYCDDLDDPNWHDWDKEDPVALDEGESIYVRNTSPTLSLNYSNCVWFYGDDTDKTIDVSGNVMSLLNFHPLHDYCFVYLFYDFNKSLTAPFLPSTTLADHCYACMFSESELLTAPELPATKLADCCCEYMFYYCTSLATAPEILPATTLTYRCYYEMFEYCYFLVTPPKLPATKLAEDCYNSMFYYCASLAYAMELPATELETGCYYQMFYDCGILKIREEKTNDENRGFIFTCTDEEPCADMFDGTDGTFIGGDPEEGNSYYWYTSATEPFTFTADEDCEFYSYHVGEYTYPNLKYSIDGGQWTVYDMSEEQHIKLAEGQKIRFCGNNPNGFNYINGVDSRCSFKFVNDDDEYDDCGDISGNIMSLISEDNFESSTEIPSNDCFKKLFYCSYGIYSAWDLILPAVKLKPSCYQEMFYECENLRWAPETLPATKLEVNCYYEMFEYCILLESVPELYVAEFADYCCYDMFCEDETLCIKQLHGASNSMGYIFTCPSLGEADYPVYEMFSGTATDIEEPIEGYSYYWYT